MKVSTKATQMKSYEWWLSRLEVAEQISAREVKAACPLCQSRDNLHVEELNGAARVHCFTPGCAAATGKGYWELVEACEGGPETDSAAADEPAPTRTRSRAKVGKAAAPESSVPDAMQWYADYCGVTVEDLADPDLCLGATDDGWISHGWPHTDVTKQRKAGSSERRWVPKGGAQPRLWPAPPTHVDAEGETIQSEMASTIWLAEGETDVIVLRKHGLKAYTAGSASQTPSEEELRALKDRGVTHVVIAYDTDKAGRIAAAEIMETCAVVGIIPMRAATGDPLLGQYKDWRERWMDGVTEPPEYGADSLPMMSIAEIEEEEQTTLWLGRIHPNDHTVLFGTGGTGKGVIAAWWAVELAKMGKTVLVVDYERHKDEWARRVRTFACDIVEPRTKTNPTGWHDPKETPHTDPLEITKRIHVFQPDGVIWDVIGDIDRAITETGADIVMVDSVTFAVAGSGSKVEDSETATRYYSACQTLSVPFVSIAHVTKADADPAYPFGSVFWHNGARVTVGVVARGKDDEPRKVEVKKFNQGRKRNVTNIDWTWVNSHLPHGGLQEQDAGLEDQVLSALAEMGAVDEASKQPLRALVTHMATKEQSVSAKQMGKLKADGLVMSSGEGRAAGWWAVQEETVT